MKVCQYVSNKNLDLLAFCSNQKKQKKDIYFLKPVQTTQVEKIKRNSYSLLDEKFCLKNPFPHDKKLLQKIKGGIIKISILIQSKTLSFECFVRSATIYYTFITANYITEEEISSIAITCVYIASKITEVTQLTPGDLKDFTNDNHKTSQIIQMQGKIISFLNFDVFAQTPISNILWQQSSLDEQKRQKLCFLIQLSLMSGHEILHDVQKIQEIMDFLKFQQNGSKIGKTLIPLLRNYQVKMATFKYSLKFDVDALTQKFYE